MAKLPHDKRLEVVYARHEDDRQIRGVKNSLPKKSKRMMSEQDFHEYYGHMGSGKHCALCYLVKGCMRFIYRVVDKYVETRMGYFFDMDTLTMSHRAYCGTKYYTAMRDRGSKFIKSFPLVFKDDFIDQFDIWLRQMRSDPIYRVYNWEFCQVIQADNDGVWMRKSKRWLALIEKYGIRMWYTDKERKETNSHAESLMGAMEKVGKSCMWQKGLPPGDHVDSFLAGVWLLNRFPPVAALARDPPDGDVARPLEMITMGWYSRMAINSELCRFVLPGTLVLGHETGVKGSDVGHTKSDWVVAKGMLRKQLIVYSPVTKMERKIDSYTVIEGPRGTHWRDMLGVKYEAPQACKPLPGDFEADEAARRSRVFVDLIMPDQFKQKLKQIKMQESTSMIKHVQDSGVQMIKPPSVRQLTSMLKHMKVEDAKHELNEDEMMALQDEGSEDHNSSIQQAPQPEYMVVENDADQEGEGVAADANQQLAPADAGTPEPGGLIESEVVRDPFVKRSAPDRTKVSSSKEVAASSKKAMSNHELDNMIGQAAPIQILQENPKKVGSKSHARYEVYKAANTLAEFVELGGTRADIKYDMERGFLTLLPVIVAESVSDNGGQSVEGAAAESVGSKSQEQTDWQDALRGRVHTLARAMSFEQACNLVKIPPDYRHTYYKWLIRVSQGQITESDVGVWNTKQRCMVGLRIPAPMGFIWSSMLSEQHRLDGAPELHTNDTVEAMYIGCMIARTMDAYVRNEESIRIVEANKTKVRAKDNLEGVVAPPKGISGLMKIPDDQRRQKFMDAMVKEISALTEMGTISHMHTKDDLMDQYGIDLKECPAVPTLFVFENKFSDGDTSAELAAAKGRMCVEGTRRHMKQGVHYDSVYAATPGQDSIMLFSALVVYLKLQRRAFDVGNAYGWAAQNKKLAMNYPRGLEQFNADGEKLYMCLHRNTYGKPDGANLWYKERDGFWLDFFNDGEKNPGWSCRQLVMEQTLFEFTLITPQGDRVAPTVEQTRLYDQMESHLVGTGEGLQLTYLLAWSDDCDMAGTDDPMMAYIQQASHARWKVKSVSPTFMLGVRRIVTTDDKGNWIITLTQEEYIDGVVGAYKEYVAAAGFAKKSPPTPVPKGEWLSLTDEVPEKEWKAVVARGYKGVCGSLIWVSRFAHKEISEGISVACRVMSKPSEKAWKHCMQMIAWLRDNKRRGMRFCSDNNEHGLVSTCDASNKADPKDSKCQHCNVLQWLGGTLSMTSSKLTHSGYGSPANEYMAIRWAANTVVKFRNLFQELGLTEVIEQPTKIYVDNNVAVHWLKTGKITTGNQYLDLSYHQPREWEMRKMIQVCAIHTKDNVSDIGSKPCGPEEYALFLMVLCGYEKWIIHYPRDTMTFT